MTNEGQKRSAVLRTVAGALSLLGVASLLSGCHVDMWRQSKVKAYYESDFFSDRQGSRTLVSHTVSQGAIRADDPAYYTGYVAAKAVKVTPVRAVKAFVSPKAMLLRGQDRYNAYCSPCHGRTGDGNGFIMQRGLGYWQKLAASYHTDRLRKIEDGYIFDVISNGHGVMYGYASRIPDIDDRWAIVNYVRALQLTRTANGDTPATSASDAAAAQTPAPIDASGAEHPINRTPGGTRNPQPNTPETTPGEKTTP